MSRQVYNSAIHHRRSIRLEGYDYSQSGAYFITICTNNRECLLGEITDGEIEMNDAGQMDQTIWNEIPIHYRGIETGEFVVMPNHIQCIVEIVGAGPCTCPDEGHPQGGAPTLSFPDVVHRFKNNDHKTVYGWGKKIRMAVISRQIMATQLLGTYIP